MLHLIDILTESGLLIDIAFGILVGGLCYLLLGDS